jgi:hypothetical protein
VPKPGMLSRFPRLVSVLLNSNKLTSRDMSSQDFVNQSLPQLLCNSSFSLFIHPSWINESKRLMYLGIQSNQFSGYLPNFLPNNIVYTWDNVYWCPDRYAPANISYYHSSCSESALVCSSGCTNIKILPGYPAKFYPYEDALINFTIVAPSFLTNSTLMGVTLDTTDASIVNSTANITRYEFGPGYDVNTSQTSLVVQYPKLTLTKMLSDFDVDQPIPFQKVSMFFYYGKTLTQTFSYPVFNSCYPGNGYSKEGKVCSACSPGLYQKTINQIPQCVPCPVGTFQEMAGQTSCISCFGTATTVGTGSNSRDNCLCPSKTYGNGWNQCKMCPVGSSSLLGARKYADCFCQSGFYGQAYNNLSCHSCEVSINNEKITECVKQNMTLPTVTTGWYLTDAGNEDGSLKFLKCTPATACANGFCSSGYTGYLCGSCVPLQYYRQDLACKQCSSNAGLSWALMIFCVLILDFLILMAAYPSATKTVSISITVTWVQIISLFAEVPVSWPSEVLNVFSAFSLTNFNVDLFSPECSVPLNFWSKWLLKLCVPFIVFGGMLLIFVIQETFSRFFPQQKSLFLLPILFAKSRSKREERFFVTSLRDPFRYSRYIYGPVVIVSIFYSFLSSLAFQPLMCVAQQDGTYAMALNSSANCFDSTWLSYLPVTVFFVLLYPVGIPVTLGIIFFKNMERSETDQFRKFFGGVTLSYRSHLFWWEAVDLIRRVSIVMLLKVFFLFQMKFLQLFLAVMVLFIYLVFYVFLQPFKRAEMNFLATCWMIASIICLFSGVVFKVSELQAFERTSFTVVVIFVLASCLCLSLWVLLMEVMSHYRILTLQDAKNTNFFAIAENRKKMLQERYPDTHEIIWAQVSYLSLSEQDRFFKELVRLERVERQVIAASMLDDQDLPDFAYSRAGTAEATFSPKSTIATISVRQN